MYILYQKFLNFANVIFYFDILVYGNTNCKNNGSEVVIDILLLE